MRIFPVAAVAVVAGTLIGATSAYWSVGRSHDIESLFAGGGGVKAIALPEFRIDATTHNFGTMERGSSKSHTFKVTNSGDAPLQIAVGATSCKCTIGDVENQPIPAGKTVDVTLRWEAKALAGPFRQTATLLTNDPRSPHVELQVEGEVINVAGLQPQEWLFDKIPAGEERTDSIYLMSFERDGFEVSSTSIEPSEGEKYFGVTVHEVPRDELPDPKAKSGVRLDVTLRGQVPLGPLHHWVLVKTNLPEFEERAIPILGRVVGDISIHGPSWNEESGRLYIGMVDQQEGNETRMLISVKGKHAEGVEISVGATEPEHLQVEVGEHKKVRDQVHVPLTLSIPPGTVPSNHLGTAQGQPGRVTLRTNHPVTPEISFEVLYAVQKSQPAGPGQRSPER